ncbi:hypothetical protein CCMA1212_004637 [Trichoderma ghanense]|uniref:Uncharacterized protein n=1 Tax=Trichoderma ghanense TaxID=65468 RepID=A0ABY2H4Z3_9HYPO
MVGLACQPQFQPSGFRSIVAELNARIGLLCNTGKDHGGRSVSISSTHLRRHWANVPGDAAGPVA